MAMESVFESYFKPETRSSGAKLISEEKVSLSGGSEKGVTAFVRATPPVRVGLSAEGITNPTIHVDCNCSSGKKGQFCKHSWAVILLAADRYPDFFNEKTTLEIRAPVSDERSAKKEEYRENAKAKASEYRKAAYQRAKTFAKERKTGKSPTPSAPVYPAEVETAFSYFQLNGFPLEDDLSEEAVGKAKRQLSRIFHPDRGGSHEEVTELNHHCEMVVRFIREDPS